MLAFLQEHLPERSSIRGRFVEPFLGGGAVFFAVAPRAAVLGDINGELIDLYRGIVRSPDRVWRLYRAFPTDKRGYKAVRALDPQRLTPLQRAARSLFLNRTCFKGMWRQNQKGNFNVGYGGQDRRWAIRRGDLCKVAELLKSATLHCCDFEQIVDASRPGDFLFLDPPYRPGEKEQVNDHYIAKQFTFGDHKRLARALKRATVRGVPWAVTVSDHLSIRRLYPHCKTIPIPNGTGGRPGILSARSGEVLISNS